MKKIIIVLVGIPCSGKSTYTDQYEHRPGYGIIGRDRIRDDYFPKPYLHKPKDEEDVSLIFYEQFKSLLLDESITHIIVDNTHCKEKYINVYIDKLIKKTYKDFTAELRIIFFDNPLWKSHVRNVLRFLTTGRWIPLKIINDMNRNYKKINRKKYEQYMVYK